MNTIQQVDDFFTELFSRLGSDFTFSTFIVLLTGIILGFLICASIYGIMLMISIKNDEQFKMDLKLNHIPDADKLHEAVEEIKERYVRDTEGLDIKNRFQMLGSSVYETVNLVAGVYYPESKYPLYELTIEEFILFLHYLSKRIEGVFAKPLLKPFRKMSVSQIFRFLDAKKKIDENKVVKAANKMQFGKATKVFFTVINYANPVYWFKKLVMGTTINFVIRKVTLLVIDIVADETNKTYSKSIFDQERGLQIQEIEQAIQDLEQEEDKE